MRASGAERRGSGRGTRGPLGLALALAACGPAAPDPVSPHDRAALEPAVERRVAEVLQRARAAPGRAASHAELGLVYEANELWHEAAESWARAARLAPDEPLWAYHQVTCRRQAGDSQTAVEGLREVCERFPAFAPAQHRLGEWLLERGQPAEAEAYFLRAQLLAPDSPGPWTGLADVALQRGRPAEALRAAERALELAPDYRAAHYLAGQALRGLGRREEAERELRRGQGARRLFLPDGLEARLEGHRVSLAGTLERAADLVEEGRPGEAVGLLERALGDHPGDARLVVNLAAAHRELGDAERALELLTALPPDAGQELATAVNLAQACADLGDLASALGHAERAVALDGNDARAHAVRGRVLTTLERWGEAHDSLARAAELDAADGQTLVALAEVSLRLDRPREAREHYRRAVELLPDFLPAHGSLALVCLRLGDVEGAESALAGARRIAPDHPWVAELEQRVAGVRR